MRAALVERRRALPRGLRAAGRGPRRRTTRRSCTATSTRPTCSSRRPRSPGSWTGWRRRPDPADLDVAHCASYLAGLHGVEAALAFRRAYVDRGGVLDARPARRGVLAAARPGRASSRTPRAARAVRRRTSSSAPGTRTGRPDLRADTARARREDLLRDVLVRGLGPRRRGPSPPGPRSASTAAWSSPDTSTESPHAAPRVMISSDDAASTGSSPGTARVTSESSSPAASEMIAAGRACRPTDEPTMTVLLGMVSPWWGRGWAGWVRR